MSKARRVCENGVKMCGICKHWYDPTNSHITPVNVRLNVWDIEWNVKCPCMARNGVMMDSVNKCPNFESKV